MWLQIDGPLIESQAGNLDHFAVPAERERVREREGGRVGGWVVVVGGLLPMGRQDEWEESKRLGDTSQVGECGAAEENLLACIVGPMASKTPLHSLPRPPPFFAQTPPFFAHIPDILG